MQMVRLRSVLVFVAVLVAGVAVGAAPASAYPLTQQAFSNSIPNLADGTYRCTSSRTNTEDGIAGLIRVQDCTRAVSGGYWQTVSIIYNGAGVQAVVGSFAIASIRNAVYLGGVECTGYIPHQTQRACWGVTRQHSSGTIQAKNEGVQGGYDGGLPWKVAESFSPSRPIVP